MQPALSWSTKAGLQVVLGRCNILYTKNTRAHTHTHESHWTLEERGGEERQAGAGANLLMDSSTLVLSSVFWFSMQGPWMSSVSVSKTWII